MSIGNGEWKIWRDGEPFSQRFTATISETATGSRRWEAAKDGTNWETDFDLVCTRVQRPRVREPAGPPLSAGAHRAHNPPRESAPRPTGGRLADRFALDLALADQPEGEHRAGEADHARRA